MLYQKMTIEIQIETKRMLYKEMTNDNVWNSNRYKMFGNYWSKFWRVIEVIESYLIRLFVRNMVEFVVMKQPLS